MTHDVTYFSACAATSSHRCRPLIGTIAANLSGPAQATVHVVVPPSDSPVAYTRSGSIRAAFSRKSISSTSPRARSGELSWIGEITTNGNHSLNFASSRMWATGPCELIADRSGCISPAPESNMIAGHEFGLASYPRGRLG